MNMKHFPVGLVLALAIMAAALFMGGKAQALTFEGGEEPSRSGLFGHWQPGQVLVVFWLPELADVITGMDDVSGNITQSKLGIWIEACEIETGTTCRVQNIVWLDNPAKSSTSCPACSPSPGLCIDIQPEWF